MYVISITAGVMKTVPTLLYTLLIDTVYRFKSHSR